MGQIIAEIQLSNPVRQDQSHIKVSSLVDTGALFLCIPQHVSDALQLKEYEKRTVTVANGGKHVVSYVGPVKVNYANRMCLTGALVMGEIVLLGAIPIEDMDLIIHPAQLKLVVNPEHPDMPHALVV